MPINFPSTPQDVANSAITYFRIKLPELQNSLRLNALVVWLTAIAGRVFDLYKVLQQLIDYYFADTAPERELIRQGNQLGVPRLQPTGSMGYVVFTASQATTIPSDVTLTSADGQEYTVGVPVELVSRTFVVTSLVKLDNKIILTTNNTNHLATGVNVTVAGATTASFNGVKRLEVLNATQVAFEALAGDPVSDPSINITFSVISARAFVASVNTGEATRVSSGGALALGASYPFVEPNAFVEFDGLLGGSDLESVDDYRKRVVFEWANRMTLFNEAHIVKLAKQTSGVTRVFVRPITPSIGYTTVYPLFERRDSPIPTAGELNEIKTRLMAIAPPFISNDQVRVLAVGVTPIDHAINNLSPNTESMRQAIREELGLFYKTSVEEGTDVSKDLLLGVIRNTIDPVTGNGVATASLPTPSADVVIPSGNIATLGTVGFA